MFKAVFIIPIFIAVYLFPINVNGQERTIYGIVTTFDSIPLNKANIKAQSNKLSVLSDSLGNFEISCAHQDKLKITAAGFYSQNVKLDKNIKFAAINLKLKPGDKNLNYAFGLTSVKDRDRLSAMASKTDEDIDFSIYNNMFDAISGRIPGVQIIGGEIIIRGNSTINGTSPALVVVDGVPVHQSQLNAMNPSTVKRINVIKDGSSAIYGSRGANGVVEIETKSGRD